MQVIVFGISLENWRNGRLVMLVEVFPQGILKVIDVTSLIIQSYGNQNRISWLSFSVVQQFWFLKSTWFFILELHRKITVTALVQEGDGIKHVFTFSKYCPFKSMNFESYPILFKHPIINSLWLKISFSRKITHSQSSTCYRLIIAPT